MIMPVMDGAVLIGEVRRRWPTLPILLMTGYVEAAREIPSGVPLLLKPFKPRELAYQIDQLLAAGSPSTRTEAAS